MITLDTKTISDIYSEFANGAEDKNKIYMEVDSVNELDTLVMLRAMGKEPDINEIANLAEIMLDGKTITFRTDATPDGIVAQLAYNKGSGNRLHAMFTDKPYLYDILQKSVYALLLKKLTPHLKGSN